VAESLSKGDRVVVYGKIEMKTYTTKSGESRTDLTLSVEDIGPSLWRATAKPIKTGKSNGGRQQRPAQPRGDDPWASTAGSDPWANAEPAF
jgi:single-strand DNA-binding protein